MYDTGDVCPRLRKIRTNETKFIKKKDDNTISLYLPCWWQLFLGYCCFPGGFRPGLPWYNLHDDSWNLCWACAEPWSGVFCTWQGCSRTRTPSWQTGLLSCTTRQMAWTWPTTYSMPRSLALSGHSIWWRWYRHNCCLAKHTAVQHDLTMRRQWYLQYIQRLVGGKDVMTICTREYIYI